MRLRAIPGIAGGDAFLSARNATEGRSLQDASRLQSPQARRNLRPSANADIAINTSL